MKRLWIPLATWLAAAAAAGWMYGTQQFFRSVTSVMVALVAALVTWIWYLYGSGLEPALRRRVRRVGLAALVAAVAGFAGLTRYEGSADGTAFPRFVFRWTPPPDAGLPVPTDGLAAGSVTGTSLPPPPGFHRDLTGFLGPRRDGVIEGVRLDPDWDARPPVELWRRPVGLGWSSFAVAGRRAVTQEQRGGTELVTAYDLVTGDLLWSHANPARFSEGMGGDGPRATPTVDAAAGRVFALGATGILDCLDLADGAVLWSRQILPGGDGANLMYGKSSSPLLHGPNVIVSGGAGGPTLLAFDRGSGEPAWQSGGDEAGYSSPLRVTLAGAEQVLSVNAHSVTGHDPGDGRQLWRHAWPSKLPKVAQPLALPGDKVFVSSSYGKGCRLLQVSRGGAAGEEEGFTVALAWRSQRMMTKFSSAVVQGGFAYGLSEGILECISLDDGQRRWKRGRYGFGQNLLVGDLILIQAEGGDIALVRADPGRFEELARAPALDGRTWNAPALAGSYLLVRNDREAACFQVAAGPE